MPGARRNDILATLRASSVSVTICRLVWELDLGCAADWVGVLGYDLETLAGVVPGALMDSDIESMHQLQLQHDDIEARWCNAARVAVQRASGRDWWWTVNLVKRCLQSWPYVNGALLLKGVDAAKLPFASWLDAAYMLWWEGSDEQGRIKLDLELSLPPAGIAVKQSAEVTRRSVEAFAAD